MCWYKAAIIILSNLFSSWYSWNIVHLMLNNNHSCITMNIYYPLANEVAKGYSNATVRILTKLGAYLVLKRIWNPIDFQGQRSRSLGQVFRRGDTPRFALPLFIYWNSFFRLEKKNNNRITYILQIDTKVLGYDCHLLDESSDQKSTKLQRNILIQKIQRFLKKKSCLLINCQCLIRHFPSIHHQSDIETWMVVS